MSMRTRLTTVSESGIMLQIRPTVGPTAFYYQLFSASPRGFSTLSRALVPTSQLASFTTLQICNKVTTINKLGYEFNLDCCLVQVD